MSGSMTSNRAYCKSLRLRPRDIMYYDVLLHCRRDTYILFTYMLPACDVSGESLHLSPLHDITQHRFSLKSRPRSEDTRSEPFARHIFQQRTVSEDRLSNRDTAPTYRRLWSLTVWLRATKRPDNCIKSKTIVPGSQGLVDAAVVLK